jgi:hypothetical protein
MARVRFRRGGPAESRARQQLVERMGALHGLPQKIGQILAVGELSGPRQAYTPLTEGPAALPAPEALAAMERALGRPLADCFRSVAPEGISASLGQVHRAVLPDGRAVAVKVQYPGIAEDLELDPAALGWLTAPIGGLRRGFDLAAYQREVGDMLRQELDYRQEAAAIKKFAGLTRDWPGVALPEVIAELSGDRILTMTWVEGETIAAARSWPPEERREVARTLLRLFFTGCLQWGWLHADPHPGNYRFTRAGGRAVVGLLDFGCVKQLDGAAVGGLADLIRAALDESVVPPPEEVLARYLALGFQGDLLAPAAHLLPELTRILLEPLRVLGPFPLTSWHPGERIAELLGPLRWNYRFAGPAHLIYVIRAFQGLLHYLEALDAPVSWSEVLRGIDPPRDPRVTAPARPVAKAATMKSKHLRIRVLESGRARADLTFGAGLAASLPDLVPPDLEDKLAARSIDVERIARDVVGREFEPGDLFLLDEGDKQIRVWLE